MSRVPVRKFLLRPRHRGREALTAARVELHLAARRKAVSGIEDIAKSRRLKASKKRTILKGPKV